MSEKYAVQIQPSSFIRLHNLQTPLAEVFNQIEIAFHTSAAQVEIKKDPEPINEAPLYTQQTRPVCPAPSIPTRQPAQQVELVSPVSKIATIEITYPVSKEKELESFLNSLSEKGLEVLLINVSPADDAAA